METKRPERKRELMERMLRETSGWRKVHPKATFREIESEVEARLGVVRQGLIEELVQESMSRDLAQQEVADRPVCSDCGGALEARGQQGREVLTLHGALVRLNRSYAACGTCGAGVFPP